MGIQEEAEAKSKEFDEAIAQFAKYCNAPVEEVEAHLKNKLKLKLNKQEKALVKSFNQRILEIQ